MSQKPIEEGSRREQLRRPCQKAQGETNPNLGGNVEAKLPLEARAQVHRGPPRGIPEDPLEAPPQSPWTKKGLNNNLHTRGLGSLIGNQKPCKLPPWGVLLRGAP